MQKRYRAGTHWGVTVVETDMDQPEDEAGRRQGDRLMAMASTPADARNICAALNMMAALNQVGGQQ